MRSNESIQEELERWTNEIIEKIVNWYHPIDFKIEHSTDAAVAGTIPTSTVSTSNTEQEHGHADVQIIAIDDDVHAIIVIDDD